MTLSLTARISALFALSAVAVLLLLGWVLDRAVERHFVEMDRHELEGKLSLVQNLLAKARGATDLDALAQQLDDALVGHHGLAVTVTAPDGELWFATGGGAFPPALLETSFATLPALVRWVEGPRSFRGLAAPVVTALPGAPRYGVALALDITHHELFMEDFRRTLLVAMVFAALLTAALGWAATRTGLAPLHRITALATGLSAQRLTERLPQAPLPAEMRTLVIAFNTMLGRLEESFRRLSEFSSDIAHELRTPVSNLMTQSQVALAHERDAGAYREVLLSNLEEYERLSRMIDDMLFLARADNRLRVLERVDVDLSAEAARLLEFYEPLASENGVSLRQQGTARVRADRGMMQRALSNLISNAIRHTLTGGVVCLCMGREGSAVVVAVENPGQIDPGALPRLFERFHTGDPARQSGREGTGLGLAIAHSICTLHGGSLSAESLDGVTRFIIRLPG